ncbi:hypothetical protein [Dyadobacter sp. OTU695]|uniref:hypothetical protein n=1 Tax=Dyadobacter sp. OTU695 TaxID=3043860 RepID=UPI00313E7371
MLSSFSKFYLLLAIGLLQLSCHRGDPVLEAIVDDNQIFEEASGLYNASKLSVGGISKDLATPGNRATVLIAKNSDGKPVMDYTFYQASIINARFVYDITLKRNGQTITIFRRLDEKIGEIKGKDIFIDYADGTEVQTQFEGQKD